MKYSRSSLLSLISLALCAISSPVFAQEGVDRRLRSSVRSSGGDDRRLIDFMQEAQEAEEDHALETLVENGDSEQVEIIDSEGDLLEESEEVKEDTEAKKADNPVDPGIANRRVFVKYEPSDWESEWVDQIDDIMESKALCRSLLGSDAQKEKVHDYLLAICGTRSEEPDRSKWCYYEDGAHYLWYNSENRDSFEIYVNEMPEGLNSIPQFKPLMVNPVIADGILSKFTFFDQFNQEEYTEYIEPLVSHLRFPLAGCIPSLPLLAEVTFTVLNPGYLDRTNLLKMFYDFGSSDWGRLEYIIKQWELYESYFSEIISYAPFTVGHEDEDAFPATVPQREKGRIFREYLELVDAPTEDPSKVFIPDKIRDQAVVNDFTLLKLDRGNAAFKEKLVAYILEHADTLPINELIWEQNNPDNYVLLSYMENHATFEEMPSTSLGDTYRTLQALRNKGIRAHAWI